MAKALPSVMYRIRFENGTLRKKGKLYTERGAKTWTNHHNNWVDYFHAAKREEFLRTGKISSKDPRPFKDYFYTYVEMVPVKLEG